MTRGFTVTVLPVGCVTDIQYLTFAMHEAASTTLLISKTVSCLVIKQHLDAVVHFGFSVVILKAQRERAYLTPWPLGDCQGEILWGRDNETSL